MAIDYWQKMQENTVYHIYNRSIGNANLFTTPQNYDYFLKLINKYLSNYLDFYAYCLMPNHFHFMVRVKIKNESVLQKVKMEGTVKASKLLENKCEYHEFLEDQFKRLLSAYALAFNKQENRHGSLFQKRSKPILRIRLRNETKLYKITIKHGIFIPQS